MHENVNLHTNTQRRRYGHRKNVLPVHITDPYQTEIKLIYEKWYPEEDIGPSGARVRGL